MKKITLIILLFVSSLFSKELSTYFYSDIQSEQSVKLNLIKVGFKVIGSYNAMQDENYKVLIYTSNLFKQIASKQNRAFASIGKILINKKDNILVFTNPKYFSTAFLQDDINNALVSQIQNRLKSAFTFKQSPYNIDEDDLSSYHFMISMPYYEDMISVANGKNLSQKLLQNHKNEIVFSIKLANQTLYGIKMNIKGGEKDYISTLNQQKHSVLLPYMVLVKEDEALILHPKYYLALSLPKLTMGEFMTIMDTPTNIEDYFKSLFK